MLARHKYKIFWLQAWRKILYCLVYFMLCVLEMIRKLITLLVLIGLVYMWYRIIDPVWAQVLVTRIQSLFAKDLVDTWSVISPVVVHEPSVIQQTDSQAITRDQLPSGDHKDDITVVQSIPSTTVSTLPTSYTWQKTTPSKTTPTKSSSSSLSDQDMRDLQHLLNAIVE